MNRTPMNLFSGLLRAAGIRHQRVTFSELFFDLVYAFAVTQIVLTLIADLSLNGAFEAGLLLLAVWWTWIGTVWVTNWLDPDKRPVRIVLFTLMGLSLLMSAVLPKAFDAHGTVFALVYVAMAIGRFAFLAMACVEEPALRRNFQRIVVWMIGSGLFWISGGLASGTSREVLWLIAIGLDYLGPVVGFTTPRLGRSTTADWPVSGGYFAERFQLFILIVLGESIVDTGSAFSALDAGIREYLALLIAFTGSVAIWWIYFDRSADMGGHLIEESDDPGRLARSVYTYWHLPMVAGIMLSAAGDQLTIAQPRGDTSLATALVTLGGPALFLWGHFMFHRAAFGRAMPVLVGAIVFLVACLPISVVVPPLTVGLLSTLAMLGVVLITARAYPARGVDLVPDSIGSSTESIP
jgi:low temperature requirement protein LtrA